MTATADPVLPDGFEALAPYLGWALQTERERSARREASSYPEVKAFYEVAFPLAPSAIELFDGHHPDRLTGPVRTLFLIMLSFVEVSFAVEAYQQIDVVMGLPASRFEKIGTLHGTF